MFAGCGKASNQSVAVPLNRSSSGVGAREAGSLARLQFFTAPFQEGNFRRESDGDV